MDGFAGGENNSGQSGGRGQASGRAMNKLDKVGFSQELMAKAGWSPPLIYDLMNDTKRLATQADVDKMEQVIHEMGAALNAVREAMKRWEEFRKAIGAVG